MTFAAIDALRRAQAALDIALEGNDTGAIDIACERFRAAIYDVRAVGAWQGQPELARSAADVLGRVEIAQQRVKILTRETRERLAALDSSRSAIGVRLYDRRGSSAR
jgi:hypothetical protein